MAHLDSHSGILTWLAGVNSSTPQHTDRKYRNEDRLILMLPQSCTYIQAFLTVTRIRENRFDMCTCHLGSAIPKCPYSGSYIIELSFDVALASRGIRASQTGDLAISLKVTVQAAGVRSESLSATLAM